MVIDEETLTELTAELVGYRSTNPPGNEKGIADYLADRLASSATEFSIDIHEVRPDRPNVVARAGDSAGGTLLLTGHVDVVPADSSKWTGDPFELRHEGDRIVGRGTSDMKGALAAKMVAAEAYLQESDDPGEVVLAFVVGEETTGFGTEALVTQGIDADAAIIGEPTDLQPCIAQKGVVRYELSLRGQSVHSGRPDKGVNAVAGLQQVLERVAKLDDEMRREKHPLLTPGSVTVTEVEAGIAPNVIPEQVTLTIDWRHLPGDQTSPRAFDEKIEELLADITANGEPISTSYEQWLYSRAAEVSPNEAIIRTILQAASDAGLSCSPVGFNATTDARHFIHEAEIPTVLFGPGSIEADAHTVDESIRVSDLVATARIYHRTMELFLE